MYMTQIRVIKDSNKVTLKTIEDIPIESWAELAEKKIFFGHKSVGNDIIEGIRDIIEVHDYIRLNIVETSNPADFEAPVFGHAQIGVNTDPASKMVDFMTILDSGLGSKVDIAFMKLCYVDITRDSKLENILSDYGMMSENLKSCYPNIVFINVTVPLCSVPGDFKSNLKESVKLLIGKPGFLEDNIKRNHYNNIFKKSYLESGTIFDLAFIESTDPEDLRCYVRKGRDNVPVMASEYTEDGGHLNERGRRKVAEQLLITLAELSGDS
jgi:hypothetical protein